MIAVGARSIALLSLAFGALSVLATEAEAGQYARISDDVKLYYEEAGQGTPLIFVPGWTFSSEVFEHQLDHFAKNYRVIAVDPRSQGRSSLTLRNNNYTQHGADLAKFIEVLGLKDVILAGWSFGCLDAYAYVRAEGFENIKAFICIDETPKPLLTRESDWAEGDAFAFKAYFDGVNYARWDFTAAFAKWMVKRELSAEELDWIVGDSLKTPDYVAVQLLADGMYADYTPEAKMMDGKIPVLNVVREEWADTAEAWIEANIPASESFRLKGHMHFWAEPELFNKRLDAFLAKVE